MYIDPEFWYFVVPALPRLMTIEPAGTDSVAVSVRIGVPEACCPLRGLAGVPGGEIALLVGGETRLAGLPASFGEFPGGSICPRLTGTERGSVTDGTAVAVAGANALFWFGVEIDRPGRTAGCSMCVALIDGSAVTCGRTFNAAFGLTAGGEPTEVLVLTTSLRGGVLGTLLS